jgi:hypothetical protein
MRKDREEKIIESYLIPETYLLAQRLSGDPARRPAETLRILLPALRSLQDVGLGPRAIWDLVLEEFPALEEVHHYTFNGFYGWARRNLKGKKEAAGPVAQESREEEPGTSKIDIFRNIPSKRKEK